ncbi:hypothetical protein [Providencia phage PSTRCR_114]|uniref:Uncharacterized protein n=1 Tax=Providencia phage PSTRCR_114 TaxID=2800824 RepID=A0A7T6ZMD4_9CAUD|nr:hypothetical protein [Providencia phage PSTRCR_114]
MKQSQNFKMKDHLDSTIGTNLFASVLNRRGEVFYIQCRTAFDNEPLTYFKHVGEGGVTTLTQVQSLYTWALHNGIVGELVQLDV